MMKYEDKREYPLYILLQMNKINLTKLNYNYMYYIKVKKTIFNKNYILQ